VLVLDYSPVTERHYPRREVEFEMGSKTWKASSIEIGGDRGLHRILKLVLLRKEEPLKAYFDQLQYELRDTKPSLHIPGFKILSANMRECARITVKRG
jgi:hypothetical protein